MQRRARIGQLAILCGHWSEQQPRHDLIWRDVRKGPAHMVVLQEVGPAVEECLSLPPVPEQPGLDTWGARSEHSYCCVRGESGDAATLLVAVRPEVAERVERIRCASLRDGVCERPGKPPVYARSMVLAAHVQLRQPLPGGHSSMNVLNAYMNDMTSKRASCLGEAADRFWDLLAKWIVECDIHVLAGDFNASLFQVVPELRDRGVDFQLGAWYAREKSTCKVDSEGRRSPPENPRIDSCGIFVRGYGTVRRSLHCWDDCFRARRLTGIYDVSSDDSQEETVSAANRTDTPAVLGEPVGERKCCHGLRSQPQGHGRGMANFLPRGLPLHEKLEAISSNWTVPVRRHSGHWQARLPDLPPAKQTQPPMDLGDAWSRMQEGTHMPLMLFIGKSHKTGGKGAKRRRR